MSFPFPGVKWGVETENDSCAPKMLPNWENLPFGILYMVDPALFQNLGLEYQLGAK